MDTHAYSREELSLIRDRLPDRGPLCHRCGMHIPQFSDLSEDDEKRVRAATGTSNLGVRL